MEKELTPDMPLAELTRNDKKIVDVTNMEEYTGILINIEYPILLYWKEHPHLKDKTVISIYKQLIRNFDNHRKLSLAAMISHLAKRELIRYREEEGKIFTYGEVISCVRLLKKIARIHKAPHGRGYLYWIEAFFKEKMPETEIQIKQYIFKYENWLNR
jgi:hypothetical protein